MRSKKGLSYQVLINAASIITLAIILVVFFIYFRTAYFFIGNHQEIIETRNVNDPSLLLNNYLRTPVVSEKASTVAELLINDRNNKDLEKITYKIMNSTCSYISPEEYCFWELSIKYEDKEINFVSDQGSAKDFKSNVIVQSLLPTIDNKLIVLTLKIYTEPYGWFG